MNILDQIIAAKKLEIELRKKVVPIAQLEKSALFERPTFSLSQSVRNGSGIIAEHKRRSPSKGTINHSFSVAEITSGYENAGVSGISVLTDTQYFGGSFDDLLLARASVNIPLLRKEFMIDPYQIIEAKSFGADAILLIAAVLSPGEIQQYSQLAQSLKLEVLLEVHDEAELERAITPEISLIGVNNRNLKTFEVNLQTSKHLASKIPSEFIKVSESGISTIDSIKELQRFGFQGFLIGENFMKTDNPGVSAQQFIKQLQP